jgi:hypothetical protein
VVEERSLNRSVTRTVEVADGTVADEIPRDGTFLGAV